MKKGAVLCLLIAFLLLGSMLVYAQNASDDLAKDTLTKTAAEAGGNLKNIGGNLTGGLNARTGDLLEREANLPFLSWFQIEGKVTWSQLIVFLMLFLAIFIVLLDVLAFVPFLNKPFIIRPVGALIFTLIAAITGTIYSLSNFVLGFVNSFGLFSLGNLGILKIVIFIFLGVLILVFLHWISKRIRKETKIERAAAVGERMSRVDENNKIEIETTK